MHCEKLKYLILTVLSPDFLPKSPQEFLVLNWLKESTLEPPSYFQSQTLYWETSVLTTSHENKNQISTLTTRMNGSQVYFHLLVFVVTMSFKRWRTVVLLSSQMIDANENFRFIKKNWKVIIETYCELKSWLKIIDKQVQIWNPVPSL